MGGQHSASAPRRSVSWFRGLVALGAVAGAIGSLLGLPHALRNAFRHAQPTVHLAMRRPVPMTWGESRGATLANPLGYTKKEIELPGALVSYDVTTKHFRKGATLPRRVTIIDLDPDRHTKRLVPAPPIQVTRVTRCTCSTWVPTPITGDRYDVIVEIYAPGTERTDDPLKRRDVSFRA
jgi:hypothetical protein